MPSCFQTIDRESALRTFILALTAVLLLPEPAAADRITQMTREERCSYVARLQVAAAYHFVQGRSRQDLKIHWHGDETPEEIAFVNRVVDEGYETMRREQAAGRGEMPLELIGDRVYAACLNERDS